MRNYIFQSPPRQCNVAGGGGGSQCQLVGMGDTSFFCRYNTRYFTFFTDIDIFNTKFNIPFKVKTLSLFSTWRLCSREQTKKWERFLLVRGEFFRQPILTNQVAGFLFSLRVARTKSSSGK